MKENTKQRKIGPDYSSRQHCNGPQSLILKPLHNNNGFGNGGIKTKDNIVRNAEG